MLNNAYTDPFSTVPAHNYLGFYDDKHQYPKRVAEFLEFDRNDVSKISDVPKSRVRWDEQIPKEVVQRMMEIGNICEIVAGHFKGDPGKTAIWFQVPNPLFGNLSPRDMIRFGRYKKILRIIQSALSGNTP